ncbi:GvpL/GvpF family gas vesicle protein [Haloarchaeobius amylolyticus]|uniref:GvpL/GvpF family gas vesicle protein n=1 Tax=Haloarchaeobius amylolyticus TaxID=1198296 RepID=UPI00226E915C|nr:GvpL/GvpF family gas vesicle protein [Haloarchaeobius amylolyticus]
MSKRYTYGVVDAGEFGDDEATLTETLDGVDAVDGGGPVELLQQGPLAAVVSEIDTLEPDDSDENSRRHDEVLRAVMTVGDGHAVVPMRFGMVFESDPAVSNVLRSARPAFTRALRSVEGRVEVGLKLVEEEAQSLDQQAVRESVASELADHHVERTEGDRFSDRLVLNRSYLVEREERPAFDDAVDRIEDRHESLLVQYTGPWAPYNFVDIQIGAQR